jgi:hypothetical protein
MSDFDNPYAAPQSDSAPPAPPSAAPHVESAGLWRDSKLMVVRIGQVSGIPQRCVKCNTPDDCERMSLRLPYHHPIYFLFLLLTPFGYFQARRAVCVYYNIPLWVCKQHRFWYSFGTFCGGMILAWPFIFLFGGGLFIGIYDRLSGPLSHSAAPATLVIGAVIWAAWCILYFLLGRLTPVKKCHRNRVWLSRVSSDYLAALPPLPKDLI